MQGRARPNLTGRLLKERGTCEIVSAGAPVARNRWLMLREPMFYSTVLQENTRCEMGYMPGAEEESDGEMHSCNV